MTPTILISLYFCINCLFTDVDDFTERRYGYFFISILFLSIIYVLAVVISVFERYILPELRFQYKYFFRFDKYFSKYNKQELLEHSERLSGREKTRFLRHIRQTDKKWQKRNI